MVSKNNPVVLLLDRSGFTLFQGTLLSILKFAFTPDTVANLEVINKDQLFSLVYSFIDKNRIIPSIIVVLLADAIVYEKDLSKVPQKTQPAINNVPPNSNQKALDMVNKEEEFKAEIQNFLQNIPFEDILAKVIKTGTITRLVAANKDLIFSTTDPFIKKGFLVEAVVPAFLYGQNVSFANGLTLDTARLVLRKQELLKVANLLTDQQQISISQNSNESGREKEKKHKSIRQYIFIAVFVILLIVLGILLKGSGSQEKNLNSETKNSPTISPSILLAPTNSPIGTSSAILDVEDVKITIVQNSQSKATASLLKEALIKIGFKNIVNESSAEGVSAKSSVLFSKNIQANIRENAILEINKILPNVLVLESESSDSKITILVGKS